MLVASIKGPAIFWIIDRSPVEKWITGEKEPSTIMYRLIFYRIDFIYRRLRKTRGVGGGVGAGRQLLGQSGRAEVSRLRPLSRSTILSVSNFNTPGLVYVTGQLYIIHIYWWYIPLPRWWGHLYPRSLLWTPFIVYVFLTSSSLLQWKLVQIYELVASFDLALACMCFSHSVQNNAGVSIQHRWLEVISVAFYSYLRQRVREMSLIEKLFISFNWIFGSSISGFTMRQSTS